MSWENFSILVVEDDLVMQSLMIELFSNEGAHVKSASNGKEALNILSENTVDLIISDIQMPVMDGIELVKKIREKNKDLPVVLLATGQSQLNEATAISIGAAGLMHKPFEMQVMLEKVESLLKLIKK